VEILDDVEFFHILLDVQTGKKPLAQRVVG